ncbi:protoheme IX farnesyltransferase [bacterium]|nr:protoheme IX farnesyltransferase [bacterium]
MSSVSVPGRIEQREAGLIAARVGDYVQLAKPRIAVMAMVTVAVGYFVGAQGIVRIAELASACFGILLVAAACNFLNQSLEKETDILMRRTEGRPVASGRISAREVFIAGLVFASIGTTWLWYSTNVTTAVLAAVTLALYVCIYTPLKRVSFLGTIVGAVSGALPPVLGWSAAGGDLDGGALALFLLLFAWQFPHFLAIATIHRQDYESAGLRMLPMFGGNRSAAGLVSVVYASVLIPISLLVWDQGLAGSAYVTVAVVGGLAYLISSFRFLLDQSQQRARELLLCSIVYLPTVLLTITWDHYRLLS